MEHNDYTQESQVFENGIEAGGDFYGLASWTKVLSVTAIALLALMAVIFIFIGGEMTRLISQVMPSFTVGSGIGLVAGIFFVFFAVFGVLCYFLYRASTLIKHGYSTNNQLEFNQGLAMMKNYFLMYGILAILGTVSTLTSVIS